MNKDREVTHIDYHTLNEILDSSDKITEVIFRYKDKLNRITSIALLSLFVPLVIVCVQLFFVEYNSIAYELLELVFDISAFIIIGAIGFVAGASTILKLIIGHQYRVSEKLMSLLK